MAVVNRLRPTVALGAGLVLALLAVFAYSLAHAQSQARRDTEQRFRDVARVSAALLNGVLDSVVTSTQQQDATAFGGPVRPAALSRGVAQGQLAFLAIYDAHGRLLGAYPPAPRGQDPGRATVAASLRMGRAYLSGSTGGAGRASVLQWAIPFRGRSGLRVQVSGFRTVLFSQFLAGFLRKVPTFAGSRSVVLDDRNLIIANPVGPATIGTRFGDVALLAASTRARHGAFGSSWFASEPVTGSSWRILLSTSQSRLYASVNGSRRTVPWLLFAAFALAALAGLGLLRRAARASAELERRTLNERHAVEINDNIIQGLVVASYRLREGDVETSAEQLDHTLAEAQRLVTGMLGEGDIAPGSLRREVAARTGGPGPPGPPPPPAIEPD